MLGIEKKVVATFNSADLAAERLYVQNPLVDGLTVPLILDGSVQLGEGLSLIHI